jgi:lipid II:glycine glycyltransferase (peptidoglycan interpeptide bridge formation enzyme)
LTGNSFLKIAPSELSACEGASGFLQSPFWGSFKARFGWKALAFRTEWAPAGVPPSAGGEAPAFRPLLVLHRALGPGFSFAYVPWGPELPGGGSCAWPDMEALAGALKPLLPRNTVFIRFDPPRRFTALPAERQWPRPGARMDAPSGTGTGKFRRARADVQPPDTVFIDLTQTEEALLGGMKNKWRYNVGLADRKGVAVRRLDPGSGELSQGLRTFYRIYRETAKRDGISIHGPDYYTALFELSARVPSAAAGLYLASHEGEDLAGIITLFRGPEAVYLYGASADHKRGLMAPYALQWRAMRDAKAAGCLYYDLFGIPPDENPAHPMAGLYRFKTGFGGTIFHRLGSWDYSYKPLLTGLYSMAEKTRKKIRDMKKRKKK